MALPFSYEGKRVVVSGGGGAGMGAAAVEGLAQLGAEIHVLDLKDPPVEVASHQIVDLREPDAGLLTLRVLTAPEADRYAMAWDRSLTEDEFRARLEEARTLVDTSDDWIKERTGIEQRHIAEPGELTSDLGIAASRQAIVRAGIEIAARAEMAAGATQYQHTAALVFAQTGKRILELQHHGMGERVSAFRAAEDQPRHRAVALQPDVGIVGHGQSLSWRLS